MITTARERWLVLDDVASDRRRFIMAFENFKDSIEIVTAATVTEVQEYLASNLVNVCLLDFFLRGTTTESLIVELRKRFPEMPIIVVSGHTGKDENIYRAGADVVIPKVMDLDAFTTIVNNAVLHAKTLRKTLATTDPLQQIYLNATLAKSFRKIAATSKGNIFVISDPGMGRSTLARALAEKIRINSSVQISVLEFICTQSHTPEDIDTALFGVSGTKTTAESQGVLVRAQNGILILENAQLLPTQAQERLIAFASRRKMKTNNGTFIRSDSVRIIFTMTLQTNQSNFISNFKKRIASFQIEIPPFSKLLKEAPNLIEFLFVRTINHRPISLERGIVSEIVKRINENADVVTLRSLATTIEEAVTQTLANHRSIVIRPDFGKFESLFDHRAILPSEMRQFTLSIDDKIGITPWHELYQIVRNGSIEEAELIVRKLMVNYAMLKHRGNKSKVAAHLGVARQHLYKPALKEAFQPTKKNRTKKVS